MNNIKSAYSYNAYIDSEALDAINILIFNHGTQSKVKGRTVRHSKDCENCEYPLNYNIISEPKDRIINGKIISGQYDSDFVLKVGTL